MRERSSTATMAVPTAGLHSPGGDSLLDHRRVDLGEAAGLLERGPVTTSAPAPSAFVEARRRAHGPDVSLPFAELGRHWSG